MLLHLAELLPSLLAWPSLITELGLEREYLRLRLVLVGWSSLSNCRHVPPRGVLERHSAQVALTQAVHRQNSWCITRVPLALEGDSGLLAHEPRDQLTH